MEASKRS